jgi:hypothetical protein
MVDEVEERIVEAREPEAVHRTVGSGLRLPHAIDGALQPGQLGPERSGNDHEPVPFEVLLHRA